MIPSIRVLGQTNDEKGDQLEKLTYILLAHLGFHDISTNFKGAGGEEVDLRAKYRPPGFDGRAERVAICECKAHSAPSNMDAWLKFCGKVFTEETRSGNEPDGYFISLSGVNGNVLGNYEALGARRDRIRILAGTDLLQHMVRCFPIAPPGHVRVNVAALTDRPVTTVDIAYYNARVFWLVQFAGDGMALLGPDGGLLPDEVLRACAPALSHTIPAVAIVDLHGELAAKHARRICQRFILSRLMLRGGIARVDELRIPEAYALSAEDDESRAEWLAASDATILREEVQVLRDGGVLDTNGDEVRLSGSVREDPERRMEVFRTILERFPTDWPGCQLYDEFLDLPLVERIAHDHGLGALSPSDLQRLQALLRWSPSCLKWILDEDNVMPDRSKGLVDAGTQVFDELLQIKKSRVFNELNRILVADGLDAHLCRYLHELRGVREIEVSTTVHVKGEQEALLTDAASQRMRLVVFAEETAPRVCQILVPESAPQPWGYPERSASKLMKQMSRPELERIGAVLEAAGADELLERE